ncbi:hypothetical protein TNCV_2712341 [Trichonephila clavipes]|nr:hypothetical protein TNCV_2712341 [Trichonephila clavipes]
MAPPNTPESALDLTIYRPPSEVYQRHNTPEQQVYMPPSEVYMPPSEVYMPPSEVYMHPSEVYMPPSEVYMPPSEVYMPPSEVYMPPSEVCMPPSEVYRPDLSFRRPETDELPDLPSCRRPETEELPDLPSLRRPETEELTDLPSLRRPETEERPVTQPRPEQQPVQRPVQQNVQRHVQQPATQPEQQPATQPVQQPATQLVQQPATQPATRPLASLMIPKARWYPPHASPFPKRETQEPAPPQNSPLPPSFLLRPAFPAMDMIKIYFDSNFVQHIQQTDFNMDQEEEQKWSPDQPMRRGLNKEDQLEPEEAENISTAHLSKRKQGQQVGRPEAEVVYNSRARRGKEERTADGSNLSRF